jgi:hypothetical protein
MGLASRKAGAPAPAIFHLAVTVSLNLAGVATPLTVAVT